MKQFKIFLAILWAGFFVGTSCGHMKEGVERRGAGGNKDEVNVVTYKTEAPDSNEKLAYLIRRKNYSKALDVITNDIGGGKKEVTYQKEYISAINGLINEGKKKLGKEDYENSGLIFSTVIDMYPVSKSINEKVSEKPETIGEYINISSEKLMEYGLSEYRDGNLGVAIKIWRKILRFNPEYVEARNAIETATIQLKNLKSLKRGK